MSVVSHRSSDQSKTTSSGPSTAIEAATVEAIGGREDAVEVVCAGNEEGGVDTVEVVVDGASIAGGAAVLDEETEDGLSPPEHVASVSVTITARRIRCICRYYSGRMRSEGALGWGASVGFSVGQFFESPASRGMLRYSGFPFRVRLSQGKKGRHYGYLRAGFNSGRRAPPGGR